MMSTTAELLKDTRASLSRDSFEDLASLWQGLKGELADIFGEATYKSWLESLSYKEFFGGRLVVAAPTRFKRDWIQNHCASRILELLRKKNPSILAFDIVVDAMMNGRHLTSISPSKGGRDEGSDGPLAVSDEGKEPFDLSEDKEVLGSRLEPRYVFDKFVVGKSNELAHAAARRVAEADKVTFNPLFLYGGVGLGKTHLMHAIAWHIRKCHPHRKVLYLSAEKFMYLFIRALRFKDTVAFKEQFRSVDVLMIDDFQFISGKESTQEEFFHTFNALVDQNHQVIISADKSPSDLEGLEERMRSRLGWGLVADIHPTTYELRLGILQAKCEEGKLDLPLNVLEFLAHKITSNVRELEGSLNRIVAHSTLVGRKITLESTQEVLRDLLRASDRRVSIEEIQKKVAEHYKIRLSDIHSPRRLRTLARPRQIAMYLAKQLTSNSLPEIGRKFGGRDHTTVMHAVRKIEELKAQDMSVAEDLDLLSRMLQC